VHDDAANIGKKQILVTGCAGFVGSNMVDYLLKQGLNVIGIDNVVTGKLEFLNEAFKSSRFRFYNFDLLLDSELSKIMRECEFVYHFSANADVRFGPNKPHVDLEQNTIVTHRVLEAMRVSDVKQICFSSTGSIYGESSIIPTPEDSPFPIQTSLYGASKLACEGMISAYCESFGIQAWIFRFVSILGPRYTHGHVFDFYKQLVVNPGVLKILGDGNQKKSYLHVSDCLSGIEFGIKNFKDRVNIINLGHNGYISVKESINFITRELNVNPTIEFGNEERGWVGDNPFIFLDTNKIKSTGWTPEFSIERGVIDTIKFLKENSWLFVHQENF
jgi:UDP-glucose 4-epimerase